MAAVRAELGKLKRSLSWGVVIALPITIVLGGAATRLTARRPLPDGWHTVWLQSVVFYGLFPLSIGIGILASLVWRVEHQSGNWNALMSGPTSARKIVAAKTTVVALLAAAMQVVVLAVVIVVGKLGFGLAGMLPIEYLVASVVIAAACVPVAALQSALSMLLRSFAAPVAVGFLGAGASLVLLLANADLAAMVLPYGLVSRATQLGSGMFAVNRPGFGGGSVMWFRRPRGRGGDGSRGLPSLRAG